MPQRIAVLASQTTPAMETQRLESRESEPKVAFLHVRVCPVLVLGFLMLEECKLILSRLREAAKSQEESDP